MIAAIFLVYTRPATALHNRDANLPDAPEPRAGGNNPVRTARQQNSRQPAISVPSRPARRLAKYIGTGQRTVRLSAKEKLELSGWEQLQPYAFATQFMGAGWEQLLDSNPQYGTDSGAFGERLGAAALLQDTRAVFSDGILTGMFRQDPRYYRQGSLPVRQRILHAAERVFIIRTDEGNYAPNYSQLLGNAAATALTTTYYPAISATWPKTEKGYGISLAQGALGNEIHEFSPALKRLAFHWHRR